PAAQGAGVQLLAARAHRRRRRGSGPAGGAASPTPPPSAPGLLLDAQGLEKAFGPTRALVAADLALRPGAIVGMVGENGSGKSTLVKILSGVLAPDAGRLAIGGADVPRLSGPSAAHRLGIATVFQEILISRASTVLENIFL